MAQTIMVSPRNSLELFGGIFLTKTPPFWGAQKLMGADSQRFSSHLVTKTRPWRKAMKSGLVKAGEFLRFFFLGGEMGESVDGEVKSQRTWTVL